jgi:Sulfotransferase domain
VSEESTAPAGAGRTGAVPEQRGHQGRPHATTSKTFNLYQAAVDASKLVASRRARRNAKSRMVDLRSSFLVKRRPLPALLIIGTMRGGTSSLFKYLESHPETAASLRKEVNYFTRFWQRGPDWYRAHFPITRRRLAFEASPNYLFHPFAAVRAAETVPDVKLIVLLREPAARARSHYEHMVRLGFERRSFTRALESESRLVREALACLDRDEDAWQPMYFRYSYMSRGYYADQLERWLSSFPVENFLVSWSEDFFTRPSEALDTISEFLSISPRRFSGVDRNYSIPAVDQKDTRARTAESMPAWAIARFGQENKRLRELLRRRLPHLALPGWLADGAQNPSTIPGAFGQVARGG